MVKRTSQIGLLALVAVLGSGAIGVLQNRTLSQVDAASAASRTGLMKKASDAGCSTQTDVKPEQVAAAYRGSPLQFEPNRGQFPSEVRFVSRRADRALFLTDHDAVLVLSREASQTAVRMRFPNANATAKPEGSEQLPGRVNYAIGNDPAKWRMGIPTYSRVTYESVYPEIDLVWHGESGQPEYDFVVRPGATPDSIALEFDGADSLAVDERGDLVLTVGGETIRQKRPFIYQESDGSRQEIAGRFVIDDAGERVTFQVDDYDSTQPLVIDPIVAYSTFLGGSEMDGAIDIAVNNCGQAYVTGQTFSTDFPTTYGAIQTENAGKLKPGDVFVSRIAPSGAYLIYSTYLGGPGDDRGDGIALDPYWNVYVTGSADPDFPTTIGAVQPQMGGFKDAFVAKLNDSGALVYSTYLGGSVWDEGNAIAADDLGNAYVTGWTKSSDFPVTLSSFQPGFGGEDDTFIAKLSKNGDALVYSSFLGGSAGDSGNEVVLNGLREPYIVGTTGSSDFPMRLAGLQRSLRGETDAYIAKVSADGRSLLYSTYLGGSDKDWGQGIALFNNEVFVSGSTESVDFPVTAGVVQPANAGERDGFVARLDSTGNALLYSTYLGGSSFWDSAYSIAVDTHGTAHVVGETYSTNFPRTPTAFQYSLKGSHDGFLTRLDLSGAMVYSTYLGGKSGDSGHAVALGPNNDTFITGLTTEYSTFPVTSWAAQTVYGGGSSDAFVTRFTEKQLGFLGVSGKGIVASGRNQATFYMDVQVSARGAPQGWFTFQGDGHTVDLKAFSTFDVADNIVIARGSGFCDGQPCDADLAIEHTDSVCGPPLIAVSVVRSRVKLQLAGFIVQGGIRVQSAGRTKG